MLSLEFLHGFLLMLSVIVAIGPQNAFLLRQAVRRERAWLVASICLLGDVVLVLLGAFGVGALLMTLPILKLSLTLLGAIYIAWFGWRALRQALHPVGLQLAAAVPVQKVLLAACAVTFLNPHAIFDTVVLVSTIAVHYEGYAKQSFVAGALLCSALWFYLLAFLGQKLAPQLAKPKVWQIIDFMIALIMLVMAAALLHESYTQIQELLA